VELQKHKIHPAVDLPVGDNYSDHPGLFTYWTINDEHATLGDGDLQTDRVDWLAGLPTD
jgi:hypothetical protein